MVQAPVVPAPTAQAAVDPSEVVQAEDPITGEEAGRLVLTRAAEAITSVMEKNQELGKRVRESEDELARQQVECAGGGGDTSTGKKPKCSDPLKKLSKELEKVKKGNAKYREQYDYIQTALQNTSSLQEQAELERDNLVAARDQLVQDKAKLQERIKGLETNNQQETIDALTAKLVEQKNVNGSTVAALNTSLEEGKGDLKLVQQERDALRTAIQTYRARFDDAVVLLNAPIEAHVPEPQ